MTNKNGPRLLFVSPRTNQSTAARSRALAKGATVNKLMIRRVLVPIDFSPPSREALAFVLALVQKFRAELHLVHVFAPDYPLSSMMALPLVVPVVDVERRVRSHLKSLAKKARIAIRQENVHAISGRPFEEI